MSLFSKLFEVVRSRRPRRAQQPTRRASATLEQLDHRQLLSVNFTGNVPVDFPATQSPGVVILQPPTGSFQAGPPVAPPASNTLLAQYIPVSGLNIQDIRVSYDPSDDTLYIGIDEPASGLPGQGQAIAGDSDNNGNSATVNPLIPAIEYPPNSNVFPYQDFEDLADWGGLKYMGAFLSFTGPDPTQAQIVAGYS